MPGREAVNRREAVGRLRPFVERARTFSGWSFDDVAPEPLGPGLPWDYGMRATELLVRAASALDMGTGGGERFAELSAGYRGRGVATEEWGTNVPVAKTRLAPHGVEVVRARSLRLPFRNGAFALVLNRHEELDPAEVGRVLAPGGTVLTQQVGRDDWKELRSFFPRMQDFGPLLERNAAGFREVGLIVDRSDTSDVSVAYRGLGELVFMLCVAPWTIPEFDPLGQDLETLIDLEERLSGRQGLVLTESRFLLEAHKPG